ncbi:MAG: radical SAM family heme chaperone HemW [Flavobacteriales bacterium]
MAGIYIHIPFCKQKCSYCDFHFSTSLKNKAELLRALVKEIQLKSTVLKEPISTIYFGGGTPSLLNSLDLLLINEALQKNYTISNDVEFTVECNPDDLSKQKLLTLKNAGVNRLSIGTQSFFDDDLKFFNRAHSAQEAEKSILLSQDLGFENITIDLIYGTPTLTQQKWEDNLTKFKTLNVPHLSAYSLTVEPKTVLNHQVKTKKTILLSEESVLKQFTSLMDFAADNNFVHYEISNFAKEGFYSKHNSNYWKGIQYIGVGPSAHSYVGNKRFWNVANNTRYIRALQNDMNFFEEEFIDNTTAYNEYVLTRLRTIWGIELNYIDNEFGSYYLKHINTEMDNYIKSGHLQNSNNVITLTKKGIFIADKISSDLFLVL